MPSNVGAFVLKLAYDAYGVSARKRAKAYSFDAIKPGDIVVYTGYYGSEHYIFVTAIKDGYVYFGDANGVGVSRGCEIRWGKKKPFPELKSKFSYTYSAPYALKESSGSTETPDTPSSFCRAYIRSIRQTRRISRLTLEQAPPIGSDSGAT